MGIGYGAILSGMSWCEMGLVMKLIVYITWIEIYGQLYVEQGIWSLAKVTVLGI